MKSINLYPALLATLLVLGSAHAACAETDALNPSFRVRVHGVIEPKCSVTQTVTRGEFRSPVSSANTARADTLDLPFDIDCNIGFQVSLTSTLAGLRNPALNTGGMFADTIAYDARVLLPGSLVGPACRSDAMSSGCERTLASRDLPGGVLRGSGRIALTLVPGTKPLLAGDYTDSLVMTLSPRLGPTPS